MRRIVLVALLLGACKASDESKENSAWRELVQIRQARACLAQAKTWERLVQIERHLRHEDDESAAAGQAKAEAAYAELQKCQNGTYTAEQDAKALARWREACRRCATADACDAAQRDIDPPAVPSFSARAAHVLSGVKSRGDNPVCHR